MGLFSSLSSSSSRRGSSRKNSSDQNSSTPAPGAVAAPPAATGVQAEPQLMENYVTWEPASWDVVLDHYRVIGTDPNGVDVLLGKTIFPFFRHSRRDVAGEKWSYYVKVVDATGAESSPSGKTTSTSLPSVTAGTALTTIGSFDRKGTEFQYSPKDYKKIVTAHPDQTITVGPDATPADVPYLLPGPGDKWAGSKAYTLKWTVKLDKPTGKAALAL